MWILVFLYTFMLWKPVCNSILSFYIFGFIFSKVYAHAYFQSIVSREKTGALHAQCNKGISFCCVYATPPEGCKALSTRSPPLPSLFLPFLPFPPFYLLDLLLFYANTLLQNCTVCHFAELRIIMNFNFYNWWARSINVLKWLKASAWTNGAEDTLCRNMLELLWELLWIKTL